MELIKYLSLLVVCFFDIIESGGHKGSHDHIKLHVPEFHHHKHHTKYITIHHHHKKPKEHGHHHNIHIPKSPPSHHHHYGYYNNKKGHKTTLKTTTTHVSPSHHSHGHHDSPTSYESPIYGGNYGGISHAAPHIPQIPAPHIPQITPHIPHIPSAPKIHGVSHTVNQVKVFDSLPGAIQGGGGGNGYKVTENSEEEDDDDSFTAVNDVQNMYPSTFNFLHSDSANSQDPFALSNQGGNSHGPFASNQQSFGAADAFGSSGSGNSYGVNGLLGNDGQDYSSLSGQNDEFQPKLGDVAINFGGESASAFDGGVNSFPSGGTGVEGGYLSANEKFSDDIPVTFAREAGVHQTLNVGSQHSVVY